MISLAVLGASGSIGRQTLEVADWQRDEIRITALTGGSNWQLVAQQAKSFRPEIVAMADPAAAEQLRQELQGLPIQVVAGAEGVVQAASQGADVTLAAISGVAGLAPLLAAIDSGSIIALANKEALVAAGSLVTRRVKEKGSELRPVDSEHSAIWQCLAGEEHNSIERLLITCSGGAFRTKTASELQTVGPEDALRHPNWRMGRKITVDCATLVNKGLEVIEAHWLFNIPYERIEVLIHPQSIVHSLVAFPDGSVKAQLGQPDMRLPIQYALLNHRRPVNPSPRLELLGTKLEFLPPDNERFPALSLIREAGCRGGLVPAFVNGANEELVAAFLECGLPYPAIAAGLAQVLEIAPAGEADELEPILAADAAGRRAARTFMEKFTLCSLR